MINLILDDFQILGKASPSEEAHWEAGKYFAGIRNICISDLPRRSCRLRRRLLAMHLEKSALVVQCDATSKSAELAPCKSRQLQECHSGLRLCSLRSCRGRIGGYTLHGTTIKNQAR